jgi:peptidoglycan/xylan/chitin deacetylase (PgdA/CDA1 family)
MNLFAHSISSKGGAAFVRRFGTIATRFSMSPAKAERHLQAYLGVLRKYGVNATFPITAVVLQRHQSVVRYLADEGVEFAVHGLVHTDHARLSGAAQRSQFARAVRIFEAAGVPADGFRSPYLRYNPATIAAVQSVGLNYISNETVSYDVVDQRSVTPSRWTEYQRALRLYAAIPVDAALPRPRMRGKLVEIPVSMPDDEILVDRLGLRRGEDVGEIWSRMVEMTHAAHDLLTIQLHPERGAACREAVASAIATAQSLSPNVWVAQLRDIASWWRRRLDLRIQVSALGPSEWLVTGPTEPTATVLVRNAQSDANRPWMDPYQILPGGVGVVRCPQLPVVGVPRDARRLARLLEEEGYPVWEDADPARCSIYLDQPEPRLLEEQVELIRKIESSDAPLVRLGRWPHGAASALAVTGDIDALTLGDFVTRVWEVL